jgi:hypothetical protein
MHLYERCRKDPRFYRFALTIGQGLIVARHQLIKEGGKRTFKDYVEKELGITEEEAYFFIGLYKQAERQRLKLTAESALAEVERILRRELRS